MASLLDHTERTVQLQRSYALTLRDAEEHNLPLQSFTTTCCSREVFLTRATAPAAVRLACPHCGHSTTATRTQVTA